jgi:hypothetical protein
MKDSVVNMIMKVILTVFVVVSTKMKKDFVLVDFQNLKSVKMNVFVKHLIPETLMATVVVKKPIQTWSVMILVLKFGLVVNVLVTCREVGLIMTIFYIVIVFKVTNYSTGVFSIIMMKLIDVKFPVSILTLLLKLATYKMN